MPDKIFKTLYSRTSAGQTQEWTIEVQDNKFRTKEGILNGAITISNWTECESKNVGKTNETSGNEQALKEAEAKYKKKLKTKYHEDIDNIDEVKYFAPMAAHKWLEYSDRIIYPAVISPKLDGVRCVTSNVKMTSREGNEFVSCPHILEILKPFLDDNIVLDGELYNHDLKDDFNKIISLVRKTKPDQKELDESEKIIQYHVYDIIFLDQPKREYSNRLEKLKELVLKINSNKIVLVLVESIKAFDNVEPALQRYIEDGYEGAMIRNLKGPYEHKRSRNILKYKLFQDAEFEIVDVLEGEGNRADMMGKIILKKEDGTTFDSSARGNQEFFRDLLNNKEKYIGLRATCRYQNLTPEKNTPRFGVVIAIRNYE